MLDRGEGKVLEGQQLPDPHPTSRGSSPHCGPFPPGKFPGSEIAISLIPPPPQLYVPLPTEKLLSPFALRPSLPPTFPLSSLILEGLGTCGLEGRRGVEAGASSSSLQPRVGYGPADPLGGLSSRGEGVPHSLLHSLPLAGILRFGRLLSRIKGLDRNPR